MRIALHQRGTWLTGSVLSAIVLAAAAPAHAADPVAECIGANERSLDLRMQGRLVDARREAAACTASTCPDVIQQACAKRMNEINGAIPSVVFDVKDGAGRPLPGARVSIDDKAAAPVGVTAVAIDPGSHTLRFTVAGQSPVERTVVLLEGEKEKRVAVVIGPAAPGAEGKHVARLVISSDENATIGVDEKAAARGRFEAEVAAGPHDVQVAEAGKVTYKAQIDLRDGETRSLTVALEDEKHGGLIWPWVAGGVVVAAGALLGGYFLFKPQDQTVGVPPGKTAALKLSLSRP
jgi:hypothetical protein